MTHWISICLLLKRSGTDQWTSHATANRREPTPSQCSNSVCTSSSTGPSPPRDSNAAVTYFVSVIRSRSRSKCSNAVEEGDSERAASEEANESGRAPGNAERANRGSERAGFTRILRFSVGNSKCVQSLFHFPIDYLLFVPPLAPGFHFACVGDAGTAIVECLPD